MRCRIRGGPGQPQWPCRRYGSQVSATAEQNMVGFEVRRARASAWDFTLTIRKMREVHLMAIASGKEMR